MCLEQAGIPSSVAEQHYKEIRATRVPFSLKKFLSFVFTCENLTKVVVQDVYEKIMQICPSFLNSELLEIVRKLGKNNCYIVTNGDEDFQKDKIEKSGITPFFYEIYITPGNKKDIIEKICIKNKDEKIIFVDNKEEFFIDLNMNICKNLKTLLYDEQGLNKLKKEIQ